MIEIPRACLAAGEIARGDYSQRIDFMGEFSCQEALDSLAQCLKDSEPLVREAALKSLAKNKSEEACDLALFALKDGDYGVRLVAVTSLGEIGHTKALESLVDVMFGEDDQEIRAWAAWSLGEIGDTRAIEPLRKAYKTCPMEVMKKAKDSLVEVFKTEP